MTTTRLLCALPLVALIGCGGTNPSATTVPGGSGSMSTSTSASSAAPLPPIPFVDGPLAIKVVYPTANQVVTSRDSNFIFGSVGSGRAAVVVNGVPARVYPNGAWMAWLANPAGSPQSGYEIVATRDAERVSITHPIRYRVNAVAPAATTLPAAKPEALATSRADTIAALQSRLDSLGLRLSREEPVGWVQLGTASASADTDRTIIARPVPHGTYKWFFLPGTVVPFMGYVDGSARVRLDKDLDVYVDSSDATPTPLVAPRRVTANMKVRPSSQGTDIVIPMGARAPFYVEETERGISLTLYGVKANTDLINFSSTDSLVRAIEWKQETSERSRVDVALRAAPYGYLVVWENNVMILKIRGRPPIDRDHPLNGLTIAVDPGHPPIGATGPTGLWEPQVTLPVSERLRRILTERGAHVVMTRTTDNPVALGDRPIIARRANVNAFVSIHLNAYGDGTNPFVAPGTGTYFFRTHSEPLAREVQRGMVRQMGLADLGVNYDNLAVVRGTWYPAVLCEGAFIILPDQEAALRTPEFQERYARGVADGIENYFRNLGR